MYSKDFSNERTTDADDVSDTFCTGTLQVEFRYLAKATGKSEYATAAMRALDEVLKLDSGSGLFPTFIYNTKQVSSFGNDEITLGAMGDRLVHILFYSDAVCFIRRAQPDYDLLTLTPNNALTELTASMNTY